MATKNLSAPSGLLQDQHGRHKRKLRLSITDRCNFRCRYCMPDDPDYLAAHQRLGRSDIVALASLFVREFGISALRITGGEPCLHPELLRFVEDLNALRAQGLRSLQLSSNASLLAPMAADLVQAGLEGVNISLDSLQPQRFSELCGRSAELADCLAGIQAARSAGLRVKLNMVVQRGINDDELESMLAFAADVEAELRFIEFMPLDGGHNWSQDKVTSLQDILQRLGPAEALANDGAPARRFRRTDGQIFGVIASVTAPFCGSCDRLRLTADGQLVSCLYSPAGRPLAPLLNDPAQLRTTIREHVFQKSAGYIAGVREQPLRMYHLGG